MTSVAILSDIHGNLEALLAVLADTKILGIDKYVCLGDTVGYGPNPVECLEIAKEFDLHLKGNHEDAIINGQNNFAREAEKAIDWTKKQLESRPDLLSFIDSLEEKVEKEDTLLVHASPSSPTWLYLSPASSLVDIEDQFKYFMKLPVCMCGHTHIPGIFVHDGELMEFYYPRELLYNYNLTIGKKYIINPGSVGQPRDGKNKASYMIRAGDKIFWRRIGYNVGKTIEKLNAIPELPPRLAQRLLIGA